MKCFRLLLVLTLVSFNYNAFSQDISQKEITLLVDKKTNCKLRYYYYPNLQAYFDLSKNVFYYQDKGSWQTGETLPTNYGGYSLYKMNHVQINDFDGDEPYQYLSIHKKLFPSNFKGAKM